MAFRSLMPFSRSDVERSQGDPFNSLRREMDRLFDDFTRHWPMSGTSSNGFLSPKVDVAETDEGLEVTAELPGVDPKNIELDLAGDVLTLKAEHKSEKEEKDEDRKYHLVERAHGTFMRRFTVPFEPDEDRIEAKFDNGVLKVSVPRSAKAEKNVKKIAVKNK